MDRAFRMESIHKIIDTKKVRVPKTFLFFWALFMILGITEETTNLLRQYALADVKEFYTPSFIFNYIIGPVNLVLKGFRDLYQNNKRKLNNQMRARILQLLQLELTAMIIKFLIKEYKNEHYNKDAQTEIHKAIQYVNKNIADSPIHTKPNKITLICILGYAEHFKAVIDKHKPTSREAANRQERPFDASYCHPLSKMYDLIDKKECFVRNGEKCLPDLWDLNEHFNDIREGKIIWKKVFCFKDEETENSEEEETKNPNIKKHRTEDQQVLQRKKKSKTKRKHHHT